MTADEKIKFLRQYSDAIGHTAGTPFNKATVSLDTGYLKNHGLFEMGYIVDLLEHLFNLKYQDAKPTDKFVYDLLDARGLIDGYAALNEKLKKE